MHGYSSWARWVEIFEFPFLYFLVVPGQDVLNSKILSRVRWLHCQARLVVARWSPRFWRAPGCSDEFSCGGRFPSGSPAVVGNVVALSCVREKHVPKEKRRRVPAGQHAVQSSNSSPVRKGGGTCGVAGEPPALQEEARLPSRCDWCVARRRLRTDRWL